MKPRSKKGVSDSPSYFTAPVELAMKAPRLSKSKSNDGSSKLADSPSSDENPAITIKASFEDLRSPTSRELLRQHFTGAFPETHRTPSQTSADTNAMGMKDRLSRSTSSLRVGQNDAALLSSSTIDSFGTKRLSTVRESNAKIDIEQAISILQELKKSASPDELVALHKALLPTRDSIIPSPSLPINDESSNGFSSASVIRHRSMLPPGLATRGGTSEDLLRKREDVPASRKLKKKSSLHQASSHSDLAALDLADDFAHPRAATPSDNGYSQIGQWRHGTLRVTNGAASPEPSISGSTIRNLIMEDQEPLFEDSIGHRAILSKTKSLVQASDQQYCTAHNTPLGRPSHGFQLPSTDFTGNLSDLIFDQQTRPRNKSISGIPVPRDRDESQPRMHWIHRPRRSRDDSQATPQAREKSQTDTSHSSDSSQSRIPLLVVDTRPSKQSLNAIDPQVSIQSLKNLEQRVSAQSLNCVRSEIDDGRISPVGAELPRFAQRWSARATKFSSDNVTDSALTTSPYEDTTTLRSYEDRLSLSKRLSTVYSTVYDGEADDEDAPALGSPEVAMSQLTGTIEQKMETPARVFNSTGFGRPSQPQHVDSGYGTDSSLLASQPEMSKEAGSNSRLEMIPNEGVSSDDDGKSLYTFDQVLRSPLLLGALSTPSPPPTTTSKKHSSFLNLSSSRGRSSNIASSPLSPGLTGSTVESSSTEQKGTKSQKKLQKPMPPSVRKERKEQMKRKKEESEVQEVIPQEPSGVSSAAASIHPRFSFEAAIGSAALSSPNPELEELQSDGLNVRAEVDSNQDFTSGCEAPVVARVPSVRQRNKSRGRWKKRSSSAHNVASDNEGRERGQSRSRDKLVRQSTDTTSKHPAFDIKQIPSDGGSAGDAKEPTDDEVLPLWTDHASVSRSLGCGPYDISTSLFKRTVSVPNAVMHQIQSPHQITTAFPRTRSGGLIGMDSGMASELARMKSRDVAMKNNEEMYKRPKIATPKSRSEGGLKKEDTSRDPMLAEERFPDRGRKSRSQTPAFEPFELSARPLSAYSESIPPMPELPPNVQMKVMKVNELVSKKVRDSAPATPTITTPNSEERFGDSTLSVAEAIRRAASGPKTPKVNQDEQSRRSTRSRTPGPRGARPKSSLQMQSRDIYNSSSEESLLARPDNEPISCKSQDSSPTQGPPQQDLAGWEQQAENWRERRRSIGQSLGKPEPTQGQYDSPIEASKAPGIIVSRQRTLSSATHTSVSTTTITTTTFIGARGRTIDSAAQHANAYRDLIGDVEVDAVEDESDALSAYSNTLDAAVQTPNQKVVVSHPSSQRPTMMLETPATGTERARSPGGRVITPSGNYYPYSPVEAAQAQRSRAESLAKLTGATVERSARARKVSQPVPVKQKVSFDTLHDRYSGGLQYNYERGAGVGGSAGTRARADTARRKSKELSEGLGLDLSDVPFFLKV